MGVEAQDLRIGNYVKLNNPEYWPQKNGHVMMVTGIFTKSHKEHFDWSVSMLDIYNLPFKVDDLWIYAGTSDEISQYAKYIEPIPLTEEWLLKFGFDFGIKLECFVKGRHRFAEKKGQYGFHGYLSESCIFYFGNCTQIKYVHQLQNLYYALTMEELKLN